MTKKELLDELNKKYGKEKIPNNEDIALQKEIDTLTLKLAENPANADAKVVLHDEIVLPNKLAVLSSSYVGSLRANVRVNKLHLKN